jgi:hypothetical protein
VLDDPAARGLRQGAHAADQALTAPVTAFRPDPARYAILRGVSKAPPDDEAILRLARAAFRNLPGESVARGPTAYGAVLPEAISHYSDAAGALGIVSKNEFWATNALFMNDAAELKLARPLLAEALDAGLTAHVSDTSLRQPLADAFWSAYDAANRDPGIYVTCFSTYGDQLGQWRGYGVHGGGYSITYDGQELATLAACRDDLEFVEVLYEKSRQRRAAEVVIAGVCESLEEFLKKDTGIPRDAMIRMVGFMGAQFAQGLAYRLKDEAFAEEREWRLIYQHDPTHDGDILKREFRVAGGRLLPFVRIATGATAPKHITVGPTAHPEIGALSMRYLLDDAGLNDVALEPSNITLRA